MNFGTKNFGFRFSVLAVTSGVLCATGCATRRFNTGVENNVKSKDSTSQSEFEVCGKQHELKKGSDVRLFRLNPNSADLLSSKRNQAEPQRYVQIDLSSIENNNAKAKFRQCFTVTDANGVLVASSSRAMNTKENSASIELVACGKLTEEENGFKLVHSALSAREKDFWLVARKKSFDAELQKIARSQNEVCVIGKPVKVEEGIAIVFDDHSYVFASESKTRKEN